MAGMDLFRERIADACRTTARRTGVLPHSPALLRSGNIAPATECLDTYQHLQRLTDLWSVCLLSDLTHYAARKGRFFLA